MVREIVLKAEMYMQSQLSAAIASDQRAMTLVGVFVATATAGAGGAFAFWQTTGDIRLLLTGVVSAALLLVAASFCMWAARPCNFYFPGAEPKNWFHVRDGNLVEALGGAAENYQLSIEENKEVLEENEKSLRKGVWTAIASPIAAALLWVVLGVIFSSPAPSGSAYPDDSQLLSSSDGS